MNIHWASTMGQGTWLPKPANQLLSPPTYIHNVCVCIFWRNVVVSISFSKRAMISNIVGNHWWAPCYIASVFPSSEYGKGPQHKEAHPLEIQTSLSAPGLRTVTRVPDCSCPLACSLESLEDDDYFTPTPSKHEAISPTLGLLHLPLAWAQFKCLIRILLMIECLL